MGTYNTVMGCIVLAVLVGAAVYAAICIMWPEKTEAAISFRLPSCRAFSRVAHNLTLILLSAITLLSLGVLLHSIWVLRP
jgi:hypothetical protein